MHSNQVDDVIFFIEEELYLRDAESNMDKVHVIFDTIFEIYKKKKLVSRYKHDMLIFFKKCLYKLETKKICDYRIFLDNIYLLNNDVISDIEINIILDKFSIENKVYSMAI